MPMRARENLHEFFIPNWDVRKKVVNHSEMILFRGSALETKKYDEKFRARSVARSVLHFLAFDRPLSCK